MLLAAVLRMGWPGLTEFKYDEARVSALALDWIHGGPLPLSGMVNSVGMNNPPGGVYVLALPYALWTNPIGATLFLAFLNVLAVVACYAFARRWYGPVAGWTSALLFAAAPWAVLYSRKLWTNNLLPPFVVLVVAAGYLALVEGRSRWLIVLPASVVAVVVMHPSGVALAVWALAALVIFRRQVRLRPLAIGLLPAAAAGAPYGLYLAWLWLNHAGRAAAFAGGAAGRLDGQILRYAWLMTTGSEIHSLAGPATFRDFLAGMPPYEIVFALAGMIAVAAIAWLIWRATRRAGTEGERRVRGATWLLLLWLGAPVALSLYHNWEVYTHYLIPQFPAQFIAMGALVAAAWKRRPWLGRGLAALIVAIALVQAGVWGALLHFVGTRATPEGFGTPLQYWVEAADRVRSAPACDVRVLGDGTNPAYDGIPAVFSVLLYGDERVSYEAPGAEMHHSALLVVTPELDPDEWERWAGGMTRVLDVTLRPGEGTVAIGEYPDVARLLPPGHTAPPAARFAGGVSLTDRAVVIPAEGNGTRVYLQWELIDDPGDEVHVFNHIFDAGGRRVGQADTELCPRAGWRAGTRVWTWFDVPAELASGTTYTVRSGLYTYPDVVNIPVVGASGQVEGDGVEWTLAR